MGRSSRSWSSRRTTIRTVFIRVRIWQYEVSLVTRGTIEHVLWWITPYLIYGCVSITFTWLSHAQMIWRTRPYTEHTTINKKIQFLLLKTSSYLVFCPFNWREIIQSLMQDEGAQDSFYPENVPTSFAYHQEPSSPNPNLSLATPTQSW